MNQTKYTPSEKRQAWARPELVRLGTIRDIAQPGSGFGQGQAGKAPNPNS